MEIFDDSFHYSRSHAQRAIRLDEVIFIRQGLAGVFVVKDVISSRQF